MSQLKPSFIQKIRQALENSKFTEDDFLVELPSSGKALLKITFRYREGYQLTLVEEVRSDPVTIQQQFLGTSRVEHKKEVVYYVHKSPGEFKLVTSKEIGRLGLVLEEIPKWSENIRDDLYALAPKSDPFKQMREQFQAKVDEMLKEQEPDGYFSVEELETIDKRLDQVYEDFASLRDELMLTKQQLAELREEIDEFKGSARAYSKGIWAKVTSNKFVKATGKMMNTPEGRKFLFDQGRKLLGQGDGSE